MAKKVFILICIYLLYFNSTVSQPVDNITLLKNTDLHNDYILEKAPDNIQVTMTEVDFGFVHINTTDKRIITITNNGAEDAVISKIFIMGLAKPAFSYNVNDTFPLVLQPNKKLDITIFFNPFDIKQYIDSLVINFISPFNFRYVVSLTGSCLASNLIWLPDTVANIGQTEFRLPVRAKIIDDVLSVSGLSYKLEVTFNSDIFFPTGVTQGRITSNEIINNKRVVTIEDNNISINEKQKCITELTGYVLLSGVDYSSFDITDFNWNEDYLQPSLQNGKLQTVGICQSSISLITLAQTSDLQVFPNPVASNSDAHLLLKSSENGNFKISVFTSDGKFCQKFDWQLSNSSNNMLTTIVPLNLYTYPSGLYFIHLSTPLNHHIIPMTVVK